MSGPINSGPIDPKLARQASAIEAPGILFGCCFDPATGHLYGGGLDRAVYRVDTRAEKPTAEKLWTHHESYISRLAWLDGVIVSAGWDQKLVWTKVDGGKRIREVTAHDGWIRDLAALPDGKRLATVGDDMLVKLWDAATGELLHTFEGHAKLTPEGYTTALYAVAASPDGRCLASADRVGEVIVWDLESGKPASRFRAETFYTFDAVKRDRSIGGVRAITYLPDGRLALAGIGQVTNVDGFVGPSRVEVWNPLEAKPLYAGQDKHQAIFNHVDYLAEENLLVSAGGGDSGPVLTFWDLKSETPVAKGKAKGHIQNFLFDRASSRLFAVGHGGFQVWVFIPEPKKEEKKG